MQEGRDFAGGGRGSLPGLSGSEYEPGHCVRCVVPQGLFVVALGAVERARLRRRAQGRQAVQGIGVAGHEGSRCAGTGLQRRAISRGRAGAAARSGGAVGPRMRRPAVVLGERARSSARARQARGRRDHASAVVEIGRASAGPGLRPWSRSDVGQKPRSGYVLRVRTAAHRPAPGWSAERGQQGPRNSPSEG